MFHKETRVPFMFACNYKCEFIFHCNASAHIRVQFRCALEWVDCFQVNHAVYHKESLGLYH